MTTLFFDTATTRFHSDKRSGEEPTIVRLAWWLKTAPDPECALVRLGANFSMDPTAERFHGISTAAANSLGMPLAEAFGRFMAHATKADRFGSFNADFHLRQIDRAARYLGVATLPGTGRACAMKPMTLFCRIEAMRPGGGFKFPSLVEAYQHVIGHPREESTDPIENGALIVRAVRTVDEFLLRRQAA